MDAKEKKTIAAIQRRIIVDLERYHLSGKFHRRISKTRGILAFVQTNLEDDDDAEGN